MILVITKALSADDSGDVRKEAAIALKTAKPSSPEVVAALHKAKDDQSNEVRNAAIQTLGALAADGSGADVADIIEELKNPDTVIMGLVAVARAGPQAKSAIPYILKANVPNRKDLVIRAVLATQSTSPEAIRYLVDAMDPSDDVRNFITNRDIIQFLQKLDAKAAAPAIPVLEKIAATTHGINKSGAKQCLEKLGVTK
jgi:HEAT repeat protein